MKWFILAGLALAVCQPSASGDEACKRCTQSLDLSEKEWLCLQDRLDELKARTTPVIFFALSDVSCQAGVGKDLGGADVRIRPASPSMGAGQPATVLRLSPTQLVCLSERAGTVATNEGRVVFDFGKECPSG